MQRNARVNKSEFEDFSYENYSNKKKLFCKLSCLTCLEKTAMSSLKDSDEQTSPPMTEGSLGVQVANSHFSKIRANSGNRGCLKLLWKDTLKLNTF